MRLPGGLANLEGARGRVVHAALIAMTTLAVLLAVGCAIFNGIDQFRNIPADSAYGFRTGTDDLGGNIIGSVSAVARQAGLSKGSRIAAIDGTPVADTISENVIGARIARAGRSVTLLVHSGTSPPYRVELHRLPGSIWTNANPRDGRPVWLSAILDFLNLACANWVLLVTAILLFLRRRHDPGAMAFAFAFTLTATNSVSTFWLIDYHVPSLLTYDLPSALFVTGWALFLAAVAGFPDGQFRSLPTRIAPLLAVPMVLFDWLIVAIDPDFTQFHLINTIDGILQVPVAIGFVIVAVAQIVRYRRTTLTPAEHQQFKWALFAFAAAAIATIAMILLSLVGSRPDGGTARYAVLAGTASILQLIARVAPPLGLLVSLLRYRLYDAEATISRSVAYGALTAALLVVFTVSEKLIDSLGQQYLGGQIGTISGGLGAAIAAMMIAPIHHRVSEWAEQRFRKDLLYLRHGLPTVLADIRETASLDQLADAALKRAERGVRAMHGALVVDGALLGTRDVPIETVTAWQAGWTPATTQHLECVREDPLFPIRLPLATDGVGTIGWLLLGPRPDGSFYGKDECEALTEIAGPVARAIAVVRQRADWLQEQAAWRLERERVTTDLAARLERLEAALVPSPAAD